MNNNNNNRFLYSAFPNYDQSASQCIITPVIGFRNNSALRVHFLHSLGSIPASRRFTGAHMPTQPQIRSHPTGSPFNTWVESSNVDKVSCWRTHVPGDSAAVRWQKGVSENFDFLDFIICGGFRGRSFHLSNSHSCNMFILQDSRGYLQHFFEFCSTICWQKGVSDRYTLRQFLRLWQKGVCDRYALYQLRVSAAWLWQKGVSATYTLFRYFFAEWVLVSNMAKRCMW